MCLNRKSSLSWVSSSYTSSATPDDLICVGAEYVAITADVWCIDMNTQTPRPCPTHAHISSSSPPWRFWKLLGDCSCHLNVLRSLKSRTGIDFANCMPEYPSYPSMRAACRFVRFFYWEFERPLEAEYFGTMLLSGLSSVLPSPVTTY